MSNRNGRKWSLGLVAALLILAVALLFAGQTSLALQGEEDPEGPPATGRWVKSEAVVNCNFEYNRPGLVCADWYYNPNEPPVVTCCIELKDLGGTDVNACYEAAPEQGPPE